MTTETNNARTAAGAGAEAGSPSEPILVRIRPRRWILGVLIVCVLAEILFVILDYHIAFGRASEYRSIQRLFNNAREDSLSSWFAIAQTTLIAVTIWLVAVVNWAGGARGVRRWGWVFLASFFSYLSADDGATLHERFGTVFRTQAVRESADTGTLTWSAKILEWFPSYGWQVAVLPFFLAIGIFMLVFLWRELKVRRLRLALIGAFMCFATAVGLDFIEGLDEDHDWNVYTILSDRYEGLGEWTEERFGRNAYDTVRHFQKSVEESTEMCGMTLLWVTFLTHLSIIGATTNVRVERRPEAGDRSR